MIVKYKNIKFNINFERSKGKLFIIISSRDEDEFNFKLFEEALNIYLIKHNIIENDSLEDTVFFLYLNKFLLSRYVDKNKFFHLNMENIFCFKILNMEVCDNKEEIAEFYKLNVTLSRADAIEFGENEYDFYVERYKKIKRLKDLREARRRERMNKIFSIPKNFELPNMNMSKISNVYS